MNEEELNGQPEETGKKAKKPKKQKAPKKEKAPKKPKPPKPQKTKICPECKSEIPKKAKICPHCAAKQKQTFPIVMAITVAVVALLAAAFVSIFIFHFPIDPPFDLPFLSHSVNDTPLAAAMELSKKEEESVLAVFDQCGIQAITDAKVSSSNANSSVYLLSDKETSLYPDTQNCIVVQLDNATKTVDSINFNDNPVYRNGEVVAQVTDFYLGTAERDNYLSLTLTAVEGKLELPETAVFPAKSHWSYTMEEEGGVTVRSNVSTKTFDGDMENRDFEATFDAKDNLVNLVLGEPHAVE